MNRVWSGQKTAALLLPIFLSSLFAWLLFTPLQAFAATIAVTTTADETDGCGAGAGCSIREAIADAVDGDTVDIPSGTYLLTQGQITVTKSITLTGASSANTTIDADDASRVISVTNGATVIIENLTITGGSAGTAETDYGGGVAIDQSDVTFNSVVITDNNGFEGGGIALNEGSLTVNDSEIRNNVANRGATDLGGGGGVSVGVSTGGTALTAVINNTLIQGNSVPNNNRGGGIMQLEGTVTLNDTRILSNTSRYGGGIYLALGTLNQTDGEVGYNEVDVSLASPQFGGGGIYIFRGTLNSSGTAWHHNVSNADGAAINVANGTANLDNVTIYENSALRYGGAVHTQRTRAELHVTNSHFYSNSPDAISVDTVRTGADEVRASGSTFDDHDLVFRFVDDGELIAFANNIINYTTGISGTNVIADGLHYNWWGSGATAVSVNQTAAFDHRLGSAIAGAANSLAWSTSGTLADTGNGRNAILSDAGGSGGVGVIVSHGRGLSNTPFGVGAAPFANEMCSDFFTMFEIGGGASTWDVTVPVDNTLDCNANAAGGTALTNLLIDFASDGSAASDTGCAGSSCWDLAPTITRVGASAPFALQSSGVASANLGVAFTVSSDSGTDPTAIQLLGGSAGGAQVTWLALSLMIMMLGLTAVSLRRHRPASITMKK